jgi:hypothetical protein
MVRERAAYATHQRRPNVLRVPFSCISLKPDELGRDTFQAAVVTASPGLVKTDSGYGGQNINSVRLDAQLNHFAGCDKIFLGDPNGSEPKFFKSLLEFWGRPCPAEPANRDHPCNADIHSRRQRTLVGDSERSDHKVFNFVRVQ